MDILADRHHPSHYCGRIPVAAGAKLWPSTTGRYFDGRLQNESISRNPTIIREKTNS